MRELDCWVTCRVLPMPISSAKIPPCGDHEAHEAQQQSEAERGWTEESFISPGGDGQLEQNIATATPFYKEPQHHSTKSASPQSTDAPPRKRPFYVAAVKLPWREIRSHQS